MTKQIRTYEELLKEKERLKLLLSSQKDLVREDINIIKLELTPVRNAISLVGKFATKEDRFSIFTVAADTVIDMFVKRVLLSKAGFITRMAVPFLMKNFSSHVIADHKDKILSKLAKWFGKDRENGSPHHDSSPAASSENKGVSSEEEED